MSKKAPGVPPDPSALDADSIETESAAADRVPGPFQLPPEFDDLAPAPHLPGLDEEPALPDPDSHPTDADEVAQPTPTAEARRPAPAVEQATVAPQASAPPAFSAMQPRPDRSAPPAVLGAALVAGLAIVGGVSLVWSFGGGGDPQPASGAPPEAVVEAPAPVPAPEDPPVVEPAPELALAAPTAELVVAIDAPPEATPPPPDIPDGELPWEAVKPRIERAYGDRLGQWRDRASDSVGQPEVILMIRTDSYGPRDLALVTPDGAHEAALTGKMMPSNERVGSTLSPQEGSLSVQVFVPVYAPAKTTVTEVWSLDGEVLRNRPYEIDPSFCYGLRTTLNTRLTEVAPGARLTLKLVADGVDEPLGELVWNVEPG